MLEYTPITNAILDFIQNTDLNHDEVEENLFKRWATDAVRMCKIPPKHLRHRIAILQVENSRALVPEDADKISQVACYIYQTVPCDCYSDPDQECCKKLGPNQDGRTPKSRREDIVQWVQGTFDEGCELEINLVCTKCKKTGCSCDTPVVEVDVDRTWEMSHPEIYYSHHHRIGRFGYGPGPWSSTSSQSKFQLMRYASNDFHKLKYLLGDCPNVDCRTCPNEFLIEMPYIEVDFEKGELLVSYLGKVLDENGDYMIPDHPDVLDAIFWHLTYMFFWRKFSRSNNPADERKSDKAEQRREIAIGRAKSSLQMPSAAEFKNYLENQHLKRVPNFHRRDRAGKIVPDEYERYRSLLNNGRTN